MSRPLEVLHLGRIRYAPALALMEERHAARVRGEVPDALLLLEHERVITFGRRAHPENVLASSERLAELGVDLEKTGRGGDVTYHGPGQLVGYPILDLRPDRQDIRAYVHGLEEVMIRTAAACGVEAGRVEGFNGTWVAGSRKIGAVGVRVAQWVTSHGFAFNVSTRLEDFALIVPCGLTGKDVTSLERELGQAPAFAEVQAEVERQFRAVYSYGA